MTAPESLTADQLVRLLLLLIGPEEEWDDASVDAVLEMQGMTREELGEDLRRTLERAVESYRSSAAEVPDSLLEALSTLTRK